MLRAGRVVGAGGLPTAFVCLDFALPPVPYQFFHPVDGLLGSRPNDALRSVSLGFLLPPTLGSVSELALQLFCPGKKSAPKQLLRRGLDFFFCAF